MIHTKVFSNPILNIHYIEQGPSEGPVVLLLHGFPDDAGSYLKVMNELSVKGMRCIAPYLRGIGPTTFTFPDTPRAGDFAALGQDALDLMDGLDLKDVIVVGQDWGSPTAEVCACMRPDRVKKLIKLNWYGVYSMQEMGATASFNYDQLKAIWYVWMLNHPVGELAITQDPIGFTRRLWEEASPTWSDRESNFQEAMDSFRNYDFAKVALGVYRNIHDPRNNSLREVLKNPPPVQCPVVVLHGRDDGIDKTPLSKEGIKKHFQGGFELRELDGVGHFIQREAPEEVVRTVLNH